MITLIEKSITDVIRLSFFLNFRSYWMFPSHPYFFAKTFSCDLVGIVLKTGEGCMYVWELLRWAKFNGFHKLDEIS